MKSFEHLRDYSKPKKCYTLKTVVLSLSNNGTDSNSARVLPFNTRCMYIHFFETRLRGLFLSSDVKTDRTVTKCILQHAATMNAFVFANRNKTIRLTEVV